MAKKKSGGRKRDPYSFPFGANVKASKGGKKKPSGGGSA
jgi:hypothetical protein